MPALHFAIVGGLLYAGMSWLGPVAASRDERVVLDISSARVALLRERLTFELGRMPSEIELAHALDSLVTDEILLRHAVSLGLDREPAVEHRLAQIATFVDSPGGAEADLGQAVRAEQARSLGLHRSDQVVRNILLDRVARLIRAAMLVREPDEATLASYFAEHVDVFRRPSRLRLQHIEFRTGATPEADASDLLAALSTSDRPAAVIASGRWGDRPSVPSVLPALTQRELARRLGHGFAEALARVPEGEWAGPIRSRYGWHLVNVIRESTDGVPALAAVREDVRARLRHEWAEQWFETRVRALREGYTIRIAGQEVALPDEEMAGAGATAGGPP